MNEKIYDFFDNLDNYFMCVISCIISIIGLFQLWFMNVDELEFLFCSVLILVSLNFMIMYRRKII